VIFGPKKVGGGGKGRICFGTHSRGGEECKRPGVTSSNEVVGGTQESSQVGQECGWRIGMYGRTEE
jgi:hypothetical protein